MFFLALRHLTNRKGQTLLMLSGILLGTAAYVVISGMMLGFQTFIIDQLVNNDAHVRISAREEIISEHSLDEGFFGSSALVSWVSPPSGRRDNAYILYPAGWFERLEKEPKVFAYAPQIVAQVIVNRARVSLAARLVGMDPTKQAQVTNIQSHMLKGDFDAVGTSGNRILVGDGLLNKLGATVSETLQITAGQNKSIPFKIVGSFHLGVKTLDEAMIFGALSDVQNVLGTPSRVTDIAIRLTNVSEAAELASTWNAMGQDKVQSWDQANEGIMSVFKMQDIVRYSMTVSILIVAGFGIYNILSMAVTHKRREIAILRSMGYEPRSILFLFFTQGLILGILGGVFGCLLGFGICNYLATIEVSPNRGLGGDRMLISFLPMIYVRGFAMAFLSSTFASLIPARAAGKLSPIDIIRSEG